MSRTTQHSSRQQSGKISSQTGIKIPLQIAMTLAEGRKRLHIGQIEATQAGFSENLQYCKSVLEKMADSSSLYEQWFELCQYKAQRYGGLFNAYIEIMSHGAVEFSQLVSESLTGFGSTIQGTASQHAAPVVERRSTSKVISFPDRRIATSSVLMQTHAGNSGRQNTAQRSQAA